MSEKQKHIEKIRKEKFWLDKDGQLRDKNPLIDDLMNSIELLSEGLYSKETHFIFELIQNAEDNTFKETVPSISFRLVQADPTNTPNADGALIIQNNEIGFSPENVDAICAAGITTKSKIQGYIGEKGIGFKSVFRITTMPYIFSNGYQFCLPEKDEETGLGYIVPRWVTNIPSGIDPGQTTIILPLDKPDFDYEKVKEMLQDIEPETILFLSKLKEVRIITDSGDDLAILKDDIKLPHVQLLIEGTKQGESFSDVREFLLFTQTVNRPPDISHDKRVGVKERDITIAFPTDDNKDSMGKLFAYLPVRSDTGFPFLINADFILTSSRENIQDDSISTNSSEDTQRVTTWNQWLMKCIANLLADKLPLLKGKNLLTVELLEAFAKRMNELNENSMFYPIVEAVRNALLNQELLPADDGSFVIAKNAKLVRGDKLRKLLPSSLLQELFFSKEEVKLLSGQITQGSTPAFRSYLINELNIGEIIPNVFALKITDDFLENQSDEWIIAFYQFLNGQEALWRKGSGSYYNPDGPLRNKPFVRLQNGTHVSPFKGDGSPNAYLPPENDTEFPVVSREISKDEEVLEFLKKLRFTKPDAVAEVIKYVLPKYRQSNPDISSDDDYFQDIKKILKAYKTDSQEKKRRLTGQLQTTQFILTKTPGIETTGFRKPINAYFWSNELEAYFSGSDTVGFVRSDYYVRPAMVLFEDLGVTDKIRIRCKKPKNGSVDYVRLENKNGYRRGLRGFDPDIQIDGFQYAINNPSIERSKIIWNEMAVKYSHCIRGKVLRASRRNFSPDASIYKEEEITSNFGQLLMATPWLPDRQGIFHRPGELGLDDLLDTFQRDERLRDQLEMKKDIVAKLAEEAGISLDTIEKAKKIAEAPPEIKEQIDLLLYNFSEKQPVFPQKASYNADRRKEKITEKYHEAPKKKCEKKSYSKKVTGNIIDPKIWLREMYTNKEGQMICQICQNEMSLKSFKKKDGQYYFEAVELLKDFDREMEEYYIALCPLCAAMYNEFVKHDEEGMKSLKNALMNSEDAKILLQLGELNTSIRFVESHFLDIKTIIEAQE